MSEGITATRQLAALRRQGFSTLDALSIVAPALSPGPVRRSCEKARERLASGAAPAGEDMLETILSRGDSASPDALECLAEGYEAQALARAEHRRTVTLLAGFVLGPLMLGTFAGWADFGRLYVGLGVGELSAPTQAVLGLLAFFKWAGLPLAAALALGFASTMRRGGGQVFDSVSGLLELSAAVACGEPEHEALQRVRAGRPGKSLEARFVLAPSDARFLEWARQTAGVAQAARSLAEEKQRDALMRKRNFEKMAPALMFFVLGLGFGFVFIGLMAPIFNVASAIK